MIYPWMLVMLALVTAILVVPVAFTIYFAALIGTTILRRLR